MKIQAMSFTRKHTHTQTTMIVYQKVADIINIIISILRDFISLLSITYFFEYEVTHLQI